MPKNTNGENEEKYTEMFMKAIGDIMTILNNCPSDSFQNYIATFFHLIGDELIKSTDKYEFSIIVDVAIAFYLNLTTKKDSALETRSAMLTKLAQNIRPYLDLAPAKKFNMDE